LSRIRRRKWQSVPGLSKEHSAFIFNYQNTQRSSIMSTQKKGVSDTFCLTFFLFQSYLLYQSIFGCRSLLLHLITVGDTHHTRDESSGRRIGPSQRPLLYNLQHLQKTIGAHGGNPIRNPSKRVALDPRLRTGGHRDRRRQKRTTVNSSIPATELVFHTIKHKSSLVYRP
jgi:hypothetical protein